MNIEVGGLCASELADVSSIGNERSRYSALGPYLFKHGRCQGNDSMYAEPGRDTNHVVEARLTWQHNAGVTSDEQTVELTCHNGPHTVRRYDDIRPETSQRNDGAQCEAKVFSPTS